MKNLFICIAVLFSALVPLTPALPNCSDGVAAVADARKEEPRTIFILGPGASKKGTIVKMIVAEYKVVALSPGDVLREEKDKGTPEGLIAKEYMEVRRENVPNKIINPIITNFIKRVPEENGLVFDGAPRVYDQYELIQEILKGIGKRVDLALFFDASFETSKDGAIGRLICKKCKSTFHEVHVKPINPPFCDHCRTVELEKRGDDTPEGALGRWNTFQKDTIPIIRELEKLGILHRVDANGSAEYIWKQVQRILEETRSTAK